MRLIVPAICCAGVLLVAACSPDATDFKESAEDYIEGDLSDDLEPQIGVLVEFDDAECGEPESTDEGTVYTCTAEGDDDHLWEFEVEITAERDLQVIRACQTDSTTPFACPSEPTGTEPTDTEAPTGTEPPGTAAGPADTEPADPATTARPTTAG